MSFMSREGYSPLPCLQSLYCLLSSLPLQKVSIIHHIFCVCVFLVFPRLDYTNSVQTDSEEAFLFHLNSFPLTKVMKYCQRVYCLHSRSKMKAIHFHNPPPSMGRVRHARDKSDAMTANITGISTQTI